MPEAAAAPVLATPEFVVEAQALVKKFGRVVALDGADLKLKPGELLGLIGDNGAGKSVLIKCISGALVPDEGEVLVNGKPVISIRR